MEFKGRRIDQHLFNALEKIDKHIDKMHAFEELYARLDGSKSSLLATLTLQQDGKSFAEREAKAKASEEYKALCASIAAAGADFQRERRRLELLHKAYDAAHLTYKIEESSIKRQGA